MNRLTIARAFSRILSLGNDRLASKQESGDLIKQVVAGELKWLCTKLGWNLFAQNTRKSYALGRCANRRGISEGLGQPTPRSKLEGFEEVCASLVP
jgi:hypothetical protein